MLRTDLADSLITVGGSFDETGEIRVSLHRSASLKKEILILVKGKFSYLCIKLLMIKIGRNLLFIKTWKSNKEILQARVKEI